MPFVPRSRFDWSLRTRTLALGQRTLIMGILNVTPDSFSDGGHFYSPQHAPERPLPPPPTPEEEQPRIPPVIQSILERRPETILSIDTFHAATARRAIEAGGEIV